jgi:hypothetical protein
MLVQDAEDGLKAATAAADAKEADIQRMEEAVGKHRCVSALTRCCSPRDLQGAPPFWRHWVEH